MIKRFLRWVGIMRPAEPKTWWNKPSISEQIAEERFPEEEPPKTLHWCPRDPMYPACGLHRLVPWTADPREATCKNCRHTALWKAAIKEFEND